MVASTTGLLVRPRQMGQGPTRRANYVRSRPHSNRSVAFAVAWIVLFGLIVPTYELHPRITPARIGIWLLLVPALIMLRQRGRRTVMSDLFVFATSGWMLVALFYNEGWGGLFTSGTAEALDFFGAYVVARAFFLGPTALGNFVRVLKILASIAIIVGIVDSISGHLLAHNIFASIVGYHAPTEQFRNGMIRATSSFDHAILFGTFCAAVGIILLYSEQSGFRRGFWFGISSLGVILSQTSAALISISISLATYAYDRLLRQYRWRWFAFWLPLTAMATAVFFFSAHPIRWVILHLTLEPQNGYFQFMIWDAAMPKIARSPLVGFAFSKLNDPVLDVTVDSVWLVMGLRYGIPAIIFLFLANVTALLPAHKSPDSLVGDAYMNRMRTGLTLTLLMFMLMGLTVHFWSYMWAFWGLSLGIRASIREQSIVRVHVPFRGVLALPP